jgi:hypothetical protein
VRSFQKMHPVVPTSVPTHPASPHRQTHVHMHAQTHPHS